VDLSHRTLTEGRLDLSVWGTGSRSETKQEVVKLIVSHPVASVLPETRTSPSTTVYTHWSFNGEVEPLSDRNEIRAVTVSLIRMAEERATSDRLPVQNISSDTAGVSISLPKQNGVQVGRLEPASGTSTISFEGVSIEDYRQVETRLKVSVDVAERREE